MCHLTHSKTDQAGVDHNPNADKPITGIAAEALSAWVKASGVKSGAIFRRIRKTKAVEPLCGQAVWLIVKPPVQLAELEGNYGAHSLRSGYVTEAGRQSVPMAEALALTAHRSLMTERRRPVVIADVPRHLAFLRHTGTARWLRNRGEMRPSSR